MLDLFYYKRNAMTKNIQREPNKYFKIRRKSYEGGRIFISLIDGGPEKGRLVLK